MPDSYSKDFRSKVMNYVYGGNSCHNVALKFEIAANTVRNWYKRYKTKGHYSPRKRLGRTPRLTLTDVQNYIKDHPNFKSSEMGKHFGMTVGGALYWLKKLGFSYKKKTSPMWSQAKRSGHNKNNKRAPL